MSPIEPGSPRPLPAAGPLSGTTVLLVDDDALIRHAVGALLAHVGARVRTAEDGDQAIAIAAAEDLDLLLTDVHMPACDGAVAAREIARLRPGLPIVFMSGQGLASHVTAGRLDGHDHLIEKPFSPERLVGELVAALDRARTTPASRRRRVVVIEPYEPGRTAICDLLSDLRFDGVGVHDLTAAVEILASTPVDVAIVAHHPPGLCGERIVEQLRTQQPGLRAVLLSSDPVAEAPRLDGARVLLKPISCEELADALEQLTQGD